MTTLFNHNPGCVGDQFVKKDVVGEGEMFVCAECKAQTPTHEVIKDAESAADNASITDVAFINDPTLGSAFRM